MMCFMSFFLFLIYFMLRYGNIIMTSFIDKVVYLVLVKYLTLLFMYTYRSLEFKLSERGSNLDGKIDH